MCKCYFLVQTLMILKVFIVELNLCLWNQRSDTLKDLSTNSLIHPATNCMFLTSFYVRIVLIFNFLALKYEMETSS